MTNCSLFVRDLAENGLKLYLNQQRHFNTPGETEAWWLAQLEEIDRKLREDATRCLERERAIMARKARLWNEMQCKT